MINARALTIIKVAFVVACSFVYCMYMYQTSFYIRKCVKQKKENNTDMQWCAILCVNCKSENCYEQVHNW